MNKSLKIYAIIFGIVVVLMAILQLNKKEVIDWRKNFDVNKKTPFGLYVFNKEAPIVFEGNLKKILSSPYDFYEKNKKIPLHNILIFEKEIDHVSFEKIMNEVKKGSDAMIITEYIPDEVSDTLYVYNYSSDYGDENVQFFTDKKFKQDSLLLDKMPSSNYIDEIDFETTEILGGKKITNSEEKNNLNANFVKVNFGKGHFYIHTEPLDFTNYYLLKRGNEKYVEHVFSYLPKRTTYWFTESGTAENGSMLQFILGKPALRYAWYIFLLGMIIFMIFNAKRRQRIVPIIEPLKNKSVEFVKSIGNLYLQEGDFHDMMGKKAQYFLHKIRMDLLIDTKNLDEEFVKKLHLKTGKSIEKINEAVVLIKKGQDPYSAVMKEDLIRMNQLLDEIVK